MPDQMKVGDAVSAQYVEATSRLPNSAEAAAKNERQTAAKSS